MRTKHYQLFFGLFLIAAASPAHAQAPADAAQPAKPPNWVVTGYHSETPSNVFYNNEMVKLALTLAPKEGLAKLAIKGGTWRIKEIEDQEGWPYHPARGSIYQIMETDVVSGQGPVEAQSGRQIQLAIQWKPTRLGAFGVYLKLDDDSGAGEQLVWGFVVTYPPLQGPRPNSPVIFSLVGKGITQLGAAHQRLGIKWIRTEIGWSANEPEPGQWDWEFSDEWVKAAHDHELLVLAIMAHAPRWALPKIDGKYPIIYWNKFPESNTTTEHLPQWGEWARRFVDRYKQTVRAGDVLNEPWDGGSLSGWHGNGGHYREILRYLSLGAHAADPTFTVLANDSPMNIEDNLLPVPGTVDFVDAFSIHTFRPYNDFIVAQYGAYGKRVWDTESWVGAGASDIVCQTALELAQGYVKVQPLSTNSAFMELKPGQHKKKANQAKKSKSAKKSQPAASAKQAEKEAKKERRKQIFATPTPADSEPPPPYAAPTAQALSVLLHFIEDTDFYREARPESASWMFVFKGRGAGPAPDKNAAIIAGREQKRGNMPWYRVQSDGTLSIADADRVLTAYDVKGNPLPRSGPSIEIPLTATVYYVVSSKGADDLVEQLRAATIRGLEPVQVALSDFTRPLAENPPLRVRVTNAYNVPVSGSVEIKAPAGWSLASASQPLAALGPGATVELSFAVAATKPLPINRYSFTVTVKTDKGNVVWSEELSATLLVKGTPPLEGTADAWQKLGALPVYLSGGKTAADSFLQYTMPFLNLQDQNDTGYVAEFMGMWDEQNFYLLADINDPTEKLRASMAKGTWFTMYPAPNDWEYWGPHSVPGGAGDVLNVCFNVLPYGEKQIANFPPAAQKKVDPKWRVNIADYEYSLYLGKQNKQVPGDYQEAVKELKASGASGGLRQPRFEEVGPPLPEVWRLMAPGLARRNYLPLCPTTQPDQGFVPDAKLHITREKNVWHYRAAIPWSEMPLVKPLAMQHRPVKFSFTCKNDGRTAVSWSNESRSIARPGQEIVHPTFEQGWSPDTEWGFVDLTDQNK